MGDEKVANDYEMVVKSRKSENKMKNWPYN